MSETGKNAAASAPTSFEDKLERVDQIVKELEARDIPLDRAIALFKEGKTLARECDALLKNAQEQLDKAMAETPN